jgi:hypothetical protein
LLNKNRLQLKPRIGNGKVAKCHEICRMHSGSQDDLALRRFADTNPAFGK